jgi:hypothetical protein
MDKYVGESGGERESGEDGREGRDMKTGWCILLTPERQVRRIAHIYTLPVFTHSSRPDACCGVASSNRKPLVIVVGGSETQRNCASTNTSANYGHTSPGITRTTGAPPCVGGGDVESVPWCCGGIRKKCSLCSLGLKRRLGRTQSIAALNHLCNHRIEVVNSLVTRSSTRW